MTEFSVLRFGGQAAPDLERDGGGAWGISRRDEVDEPLVLLGGRLAIQVESQSLGSTHERAELLQHRFDGVVPERRDRDAMQLLVGVEGGSDITG